MDLGVITSVVFPTLVIIVGGFSVLLYGTTQTLRATNDDQGNRIRFLEEEQVRDKATIGQQSTELKTLRSLVTGDAQLAAIRSDIANHHTVTGEALGRMELGLGAIASELRSRP